jgi:hypothetical protein
LCHYLKFEAESFLQQQGFFTGIGKRELFEMTQKSLVAKKWIPLTRQRRGASWESVFLRIRKGKHFPLIKLLFYL